MFNTKRRLDSAWAKGLMFGKAVGARDERERIIKLLEDNASGKYRQVLLTPRLLAEIRWVKND